MSTNTDDVRMAAERLRRCERLRQAHDPNFDAGVSMDDYHALCDAYLAELDPSEITETKLLADGWLNKPAGSAFWFVPDDAETELYVRRDRWFLICTLHGAPIPVSTMGAVRTLLRLAKEVR